MLKLLVEMATINFNYCNFADFYVWIYRSCREIRTNIDQKLLMKLVVKLKFALG